MKLFNERYVSRETVQMVSISQNRRKKRVFHVKQSSIMDRDKRLRIFYLEDEWVLKTLNVVFLIEKLA